MRKKHQWSREMIEGERERSNVVLPNEKVEAAAADGWA